MNYKEEFGKIMREKRKKQDLTQETLSELIGVSTMYCRDLEHGKHNPTWNIWFKICIVLHIDVSQIVDTYIRACSH